MHSQYRPTLGYSSQLWVTSQRRIMTLITSPLIVTFFLFFAFGFLVCCSAWPSWIWDPTPPPQGPLFPSRMNSLRVELTFGTLTPKPTGATGGVKVRMIVPDHWYNTKTSPWKPLYVIACQIGSFVDISTAGRATPAQYFDLNIPDFLWPNGTINQYPFDV